MLFNKLEIATIPVTVVLFNVFRFTSKKKALDNPLCLGLLSAFLCDRGCHKSKGGTSIIKSGAVSRDKNNY